MLKAFGNYIRIHKLFTAGDKILLGVSSGMDSMVMAELFLRTDAGIAIAHCNFGLRGLESDEDAAFVKTFAAKRNIPFYSKKFNAKSYAERNKISIQMAARELRYQWFKRLLNENNLDLIATAHHRDDQVETFFINLLRSSGISGLRGMLPKQGRLIHPMLFAGRKEINAFADENGIQYREDSSNLKTDYLRNQIRHQLVPILEKINPEFQSTIIKNMEYLHSVKMVYKQQIDKVKAEITETAGSKTIISIEKLKGQPDAVLHLFEIIREFGFNYSDADRMAGIIDAQPGKFFLSGSHRIIKDRNHFIIEAIQNSREETFEIPKLLETISFPISLKMRVFENNDEYQIPPEPHYAVLDAELLKYPLMLRKWKKGDFFYPLGMNHKKLISDFFTDQKLSLTQKDETWLLVSGGEIAWVVGHRIDNRFKITPGTRKIAEFCYDGISNGSY